MTTPLLRILHTHRDITARTRYNRIGLLSKMRKFLRVCVIRLNGVG